MPIRSKTFFETYYEDIKLFKTLWIKIWMVVLVAGLAVLPVFGGAYVVYLVNLACLATIAGLGLNLLTGFTGQISLGHAAFLAVEHIPRPFWAENTPGRFIWPCLLRAPLPHSSARPWVSPACGSKDCTWPWPPWPLAWSSNTWWSPGKA